MSDDNLLMSTPPSLPKGGGAIQAIGDRLGAVGSHGSASIEIPLPVSPGRGYAPQLTLRYSSSQGNGAFGLGWALSLPSIVRRTHTGVPAYTDEDLFMGADGQVWLPDRDSTTDALISSQKSCSNGTAVVAHTVLRYRPRIENAFDRIERWSSADDAPGFWLIHSADGSQHIYGKSASARTIDPNDSSRVAEWLLEESLNAHGEHIVYEHTTETDYLHGRAYPQAKRYPSRVNYGNFKASADPYLLQVEGLKDVRWHFTVCFDFGERTSALEEVPGFSGDQAWAERADPFSNFSFGFEVRTRHLCRQVLMFHNFPEEKSFAKAPVLVRRMLLEYRESPLSYSFLSAVLNQGYDAGGRIEYLPPLEFSYCDFTQPAEMHFEPFTALNTLAPSQHFQFMDLLGEGLPGVLQQTDKSWRYSAPCRHAAGTDQVTYEAAQELPHIPLADRRKNTLQFLDNLTGDAGPNWVVLKPGLSGYFTLAADGQWSGFAPFSAFPTEFFQGKGQLADLMGAGLSDLVMVGPRSIRLYANRKSAGFAAATEVPREAAEDDLPTISHSPTELVGFSDVLGSGQQHLIRIRHNEVKCWPNLGRGRFGKGRVIATLDFSYDSFDADRIRLADLDGSGATDLIYLQADCAQVWMNRSGNGFASAVEVPWPPGLQYDRFCRVSLIDLQGLGCASLVFSAAENAQQHWRHDFVDRKPYLLTETNNNQGAACSVHYRSSAQEWLDEKEQLRTDKQRIACRLAFPLPVVKQQMQYDEVSGNRMTRKFEYQLGCHDNVEQQFCGFGLLIQEDSLDNLTGLAYSAPTVSKTWFHTGQEIDPPTRGASQSDVQSAALKPVIQKREKSAIAPTHEFDPADTQEQARQREMARALTGHILRVEMSAKNQGSTVLFSVQGYRYQLNELRGLGKSGPYARVHPVVAESIHYEYDQNGDDPRCQHVINLHWDQVGQVTHSVEVSYARRKTASDTAPFEDTWLKKWWTDAHDESQQFYYLVENKAQFIHLQTEGTHCLGLPYLQRTNALKLPKKPGLNGLDPSAINQESLLASSASKEWKAAAVMTALSRQIYRKPDATQSFPKGEASIEALPDHLEIAEFNDVAIKAFEVLDKTSATAVDLPGKLEDNGYRKMSIALPDDDAFDQLGSLWSVRRGFSTYHKLDGFFRLHTSRASQQHSPTTLSHDPYYCLVAAVTPPDNCATRTTIFDYRALKPAQMTDANGIVSQVLHDGFGQVRAFTYYKGKPGEGSEFHKIDSYTRPENESPDAAITDAKNTSLKVARLWFSAPLSWMGKVDSAAPGPTPDRRQQAILEGDLLPGGYIRASTRSRLKNSSATTPEEKSLLEMIVNAQREPVHDASLLADSPPSDAGQQVRITISYRDGFGRTLQSKQKTDSGWRVSAPVEYDNKGHITRVYRPWHSETHRYSGDALQRSAALFDQHFYDPLGRLMRVKNANGDESRHTFHPWYTVVEDENDTRPAPPKTSTLPAPGAQS